MTDLNLPEKRVFLGPALIWKRIASFILDLFLLDFFVLSPFSSLSEQMLGSADVLSAYNLLQSSPGQMRALTMVFSIVIMLVLAYFILFEYAIGQTPGCMLFNIHVVAQHEEKVFEKPSFWQCFVRNMFIIPALPFIILWLVDPAYLIFAKRNQRLTEWLSNTRVIEQFVM